MNIGKTLTIILWFGLSINFYLTSSAIPEMVSFKGFDFLNTLALILITVHLVECCVFYKRISTEEQNPVQGFFLTLVFGVFYITDLNLEK